MASAKNILQEYFQKSSEYKSVPLSKIVEYKTYPVFNEKQSNTKFVCTLTTPKGEYTSDPQSRKKDAELNAAEKAVKDLNNSESVNGDGVFLDSYKLRDAQVNRADELSETIRISILVDVENFSDFFNKTANWDWDDYVKVKGFVTKAHSQAETEWPKKIEKVEINSTRKDAADTAILLYLGKKALTDTHTNTIFIVLTRDHFAASIDECLQSMQYNPTIKVIHCLSYKHLIEIFDTPVHNLIETW